MDTNLKNIRLDILRKKNAEIIETFILNHFREATHFAYDGLRGYNFLNIILNYTHEIHYHGAREFWLSAHSIWFINALWAENKQYIKIYGLISTKNFIYFLREVEFRIIVKKICDENKINTCY